MAMLNNQRVNGQFLDIWYHHLHLLGTHRYEVFSMRRTSLSCAKSFCQGGPFGPTPSAAKAHGSDLNFQDGPMGPKCIYGCVWKECTPKPNGFADHYPY